MKLTYKTPTQEEYPDIAKLVNASDNIYTTIHSPEIFKEIGYGTETVDDLIAGEQNRVYLCAYDEDGSLVGYTSFRIKHPTTLWISMFCIDPLHQRHGYGTLLLQHLETYATERQVSVISFETDTNAHWAVQFYQKNGYHILSPDDLQQPPYEHILDKAPVPGRYIFGKVIS